jgi:hydroxyacylglutathione hydrolase
MATTPAEDELWIEQIAVGPMQNFVYVVGSRSTREVALVDPAWDVNGLLDHLEKQDLRCVAALITHYHPDHVGGAMMGMNIEGLAALLERQPVRIYAHRAEAIGIQRVTGVSANDLAQVDSGEKLQLGGVEIEFLHTPGHTPGSQCFRVRNTLVSGDTLFIEGCGRVDLPGSNPDDMYESLKSLKRLGSLPDDTLLLPGHDYGPVPHETLANVKRTNPYLRVRDLPAWRAMMGR